MRPVSAPALRPLSIGEVLDVALKAYKSSAATLMGLTAIVVVPFQLLSALILLSTIPNANDVPSGSLSFSSSSTSSTTDSATQLGGNAVLIVTGLLVGLITTAACLKAVSDAYLGHKPDLRGSLWFALRRFFPLVWMNILLAVLLIFAFLALIIPGIWLYVAWSVATPALLIENVRGRRALGRSFRLVRGRWWHVFAVQFVAVVLVAVISGIIEAVLVGISLAVDSGSVALAVVLLSLAAAIASIVTRPFQAAVTTILYYDLRVRREGFDVELLAQQLELEGFAALPPTAAPGGTAAPLGASDRGANLLGARESP